MAGIIDLIIPKEKKFFTILEKQITLLDEASELFDVIVFDKKLTPQKLQKHVKRIHDISEDVDDISREVIILLHKTFITPIDREEIKSLSVSICELVDSIEDITACIYFFKIKKFDKNFIKQIKILQDSVNILKLIFEEPLSHKRNSQKLEQLKDLEKEADDIYYKALGDLFSNGHDAIQILKQKELYDITERAIDKTRSMVDLLETVIINNS